MPPSIESSIVSLSIHTAYTLSWNQVITLENELHFSNATSENKSTKRGY